MNNLNPISSQAGPSTTSSSSFVEHHSFPKWFRLILDELIVQSKTARPTLAGSLLYKMPWLISLRFVGNLGGPELAAAALATTLCNIAGLSLSVGLSSAITTLTGQARGRLQALEKLMEERRSQQNPYEQQQQQMVGNANKDCDSSTNYHSSPNEKSSLLASLSISGSSFTERTNPTTKTTTNTDTQSPSPPLIPLLPLVHLYRGLAIQFVFTIPMAAYWIYGMEPLLIRLGQDATLSAMTAAYLRILAPGLLGYSIQWTLTAWLQALDMSDVPALAGAVAVVCHIPCNLLTVYTFQWGYLGCAAATVAFQLVQLSLMVGYLVGTVHGQERLLRQLSARAVGRTHVNLFFLRGGGPELRLAVSSLSGILQYLSLALPGLLLISEWWASEVCIFLAGHLSPVRLAAMSLYQSINAFCFMFPTAWSVAGSMRVGVLLGAGNPPAAARANQTTVLAAACSSGCLGILLYGVIPHTWIPSLFCPQALEVVEETARTIPLLAVYIFADGIQNALNGTIKGCGRQAITMPIVIVAYWMVGVPLAYYLTFVRGSALASTYEGTCGNNNTNPSTWLCGDVSLVLGMTVGTWVHMLLLAMVVFGTTDWKKEAKKALERHEVEESVDDALCITGRESTGTLRKMLLEDALEGSVMVAS